MLCTAAPGGMAEVVASLRRSGLFERFPVRLIATHGRTHLAGRLAAALRAAAELAGLLAARRVALVHAHVAMRGSFWRKALLLELARAFGVPTIVHLHGSTFVEFYERECGPLGRRLVRRTLERAAAVIALSESWRAYLARIVPAVRLMRFMDVRALPIAGGEVWVSRSGYTGEDGFEISVPATEARGFAESLLGMPDVMPAGLGARDTLRLEAGMNLYGSDMDETVTPFESGIGWSVALEPGDRLWPYHTHYLNEEWVIVLRGAPTSTSPSTACGAQLASLGIQAIPLTWRQIVHDEIATAVQIGRALLRPAPQ